MDQPFVGGGLRIGFGGDPAYRRAERIPPRDLLESTNRTFVLDLKTQRRSVDQRLELFGNPALLFKFNILTEFSFAPL